MGSEAAEATLSNPFARLPPDQWPQTWQARVLRETTGALRHILLRCMKNEYIGITVTSWDAFLRKLELRDRLITRPTLMGYARVELSGRVTSLVQMPDFSFQRVAFYRDKAAFVGDMRKVADGLKLKDAERIEMFSILKTWIPEDRTIGVHGEKLAS